MKKITIISLLFSSSVYAEVEHTLMTDRFTTQISSGVLTNLKSSKTVEDDDFGKLSQLDWDASTTPVVNAELKWHIHPKLNVNLRGWTTLTKNNSTMNDYDWINENNRTELTDFSTHPKTYLNYANEFDISLDTPLLTKKDYQLYFLLGYLENRFSYTSFGGNYMYSQSDSEGSYLPGTALSDIGKFSDNDRIISYKQKFQVPYLGLNGNYNKNKFSANLVLKYSPWIQAKDYDEHVNTGVIARSITKNGKYYGITSSVQYSLNNKTQLFTEYNWNKFGKSLGNTTRNRNDGTIEYSKNDRTISNEYSRISVGIKYSF